MFVFVVGISDVRGLWAECSNVGNSFIVFRCVGFWY